MVLEHNFTLGSRNLSKPIDKSSNALGIAEGGEGMLKLQIDCRIRIRLGSGMINHRGVLFCNTEENFTIKQLWKKVCSLIQEGHLPYCNAKLQVRNLTMEYSYVC